MKTTAVGGVSDVYHIINRESRRSNAIAMIVLVLGFLFCVWKLFAVERLIQYLAAVSVLERLDEKQGRATFPDAV